VKALNVAAPAAVIQFINPFESTGIQKWMICFHTAEHAIQFASSTSWAHAIEKTAKLQIKPCQGPEKSKGHSKGRGGTLNKKK
jgi:hypothetical protein